MTKERTLVIDIGNRLAKIYVVRGDELGGRWVFMQSDPSWFNKLESIAGNSKCRDAVLVSVIPDGTEQAQTIISRAGLETLVIHGEMRLPIRLDYGSPKRLGADRIATAVGAWHFYGDDLGAKDDAIVVIDAGSAITIDLVKNGMFYGGAIIPGLNLMRNSLHRNTAQLPQSPEKIAPQFPGKGTEQCIIAVAIAAAAGAVEFLWNKFTGKSEKRKLILTGGDSEILAGHIEIPHIIDPLLLLKGAVAILDFKKNGA